MVRPNPYANIPMPFAGPGTDQTQAQRRALAERFIDLYPGPSQPGTGGTWGDQILPTRDQRIARLLQNYRGFLNKKSYEDSIRGPDGRLNGYRGYATQQDFENGIDPGVNIGSADRDVHGNLDIRKILSLQLQGYLPIDIDESFARQYGERFLTRPSLLPQHIRDRFRTTPPAPTRSSPQQPVPPVSPQPTGSGGGNPGLQQVTQAIQDAQTGGISETDRNRIFDAYFDNPATQPTPPVAQPTSPVTQPTPPVAQPIIQPIAPTSQTGSTQGTTTPRQSTPRNPANPLNNPFMDYLEEPGEGRFAAYSSHLDDQGFGNNKRRQLRKMFSDVQSQFLGQLGSQIRGGKDPTLRFNNFLEGLDFNRLYHSTSPFERGTNTNRFAPRVRSLLRF